jgi:hypothetical protein
MNGLWSGKIPSIKPTPLSTRWWVFVRMIMKASGDVRCWRNALSRGKQQVNLSSPMDTMQSSPVPGEQAASTAFVEC